MNSFNAVARLTRDPELRSTPSGQSVCEMRIAVDGGRDDAAALYLDISTFDAQAEACAKYLRKGRQIAFSGRLIYREWVAADGTKRSKHSAIGHVEFLARPDATANGSEPAGEPVPAGVGAVAGAGEEDIAF